jgi:hypothetical protein
MSDDSPLGDLREQMEEADADTSSGSAGASETVSGDATTDSESPEQKRNAERTPGFEFETTKQKPMYPRQETWDRYDDLRFEVESELRSQGIRNLESREVDDALLRYAAENPVKIAELVLEERGANTQQED